MQPVTPIQFETPPAEYEPGVCNIGPAEVARRRMVGHVGLLASVALLAVLVVLGVPPIVRLLVALPAGIAASGYIQARVRFCAGFATAGVYNFGPQAGVRHQVQDPSAVAADKARARSIFLWSAVIGLTAGVLAVLLPI